MAFAVTRCAPARSAAVKRTSRARRAALPARRPAARAASVVVRSAVAEEQDTFEYQAEVTRLLDLIINSLYSNKEVFLRELVSNASDALDKIRFVSVTDKDALAANDKLGIQIRGDPESKTLTIEDSGIGMTKEELVDSLGTIARSGTAKFMEAMKDASSGENLIGKFGVGFYSAFLVADRVTVETKSNNSDDVWQWESSIGETAYTVGKSSTPLARGTRITLHLKEDSTEFATDQKLCSLVKTYSEFISFPIEVYTSKSVPKQVLDEEATQKAKEGWEERKNKAAEASEDFDEEEPKDVMKTEYETEWAYDVQNDNKPLWTKSPRDVEQAEYNEFYKATFKEFLDPLATTHFSIEGDIEFKAMLFVPGMAPFDQQDMMKKSRNMKLYVRRVFISDQFDEDLMPRYLNFVKGVVDSNDLPLNVSREILQESRVVRVMRKRLLRKSLDMLDDIASRDDEGKDYGTFWDAFGRNIKLGIIEDQDNRQALAKLLRFQSTKSDGKLTSLGEYTGRLSEDAPKNIFYLAADTLEAAKGAPFLEKLNKKGIEVLYLTDPIDEVAISNLGNFGDYKLVDVTKEDLEIEKTEEEKAEEEKLASEFKALTDWMANELGEDLEKVVVSNRLSDTPCVLVTSKYGWSANMERIMRAQAMGDNKAMDYMKGKKIMEINPENNLIRTLQAQVAANPADETAKLTAKVLFETSMLTSGFTLESPADFAGRVFQVMTAAAGDAPPPPPPPPPPTAKEGSGNETVEPEVVGEDSDPWKA
eukprot:CAMPEP_0183795814 /NCGR_PEP_ID=MMETSP0803_2-20130417/5333_1 /TAXON_ID=195967 /ORGANISM="Crustomastix stigmata, Strain CCMP3273" /LENGTH=762 /DNA_ID=CAMNT_0026040315 /DNA_START=150 /DNA_END=2438 /DNA_ORIENTATION=+